MRINTNIVALKACHNLLTANNNTSKSLEKLSSGYKINSARDNPVGAALSAKMRSQLKNLDKATQSAADGVSVIETAESVLGEVQSMVQRIRELCVQGASDSYTDEDRNSIMQEIDQMRQEIDRISESTDFNTKKLLNGDLGRRSFTNVNGAEVNYVSQEVPTGEYEIHVTQAAEQGTYTSGTVTGGVSGSLKVNGVTVEIADTDTVDQIYEKIRTAADKTAVTVTNNNGSFEYTCDRYGMDYGIEIECDDPALRASLGLDAERISDYGQDVQVDLATGTGSLFSVNCTAKCDGNTIVITGNDGFKMRLDLSEEIGAGTRVIAHITDIGTMTVQVGANEGQEIEIDIPKVNCRMMGLDKLYAYTSGGAGDGITVCDEAIEYISEVRSRIGAYQNRMEHTQSYLESTNENMTSALSRITDVDMAEEMTYYTTQNVVSQAATSMLAQANELADKVLQLLQ